MVKVKIVLSCVINKTDLCYVISKNRLLTEVEPRAK